MDMQGEYRIPAARDAVWEALNDPEVLKVCITGCESLERTGNNGFEATVKAKIGPVKATFKGAVRLENVNAPESYTVVGEGKGGAAGFAKGGADVSLADDGGETVLNYAVNAQVGGKLAQIGGRLVDSIAKKYANEFFEKFVEITQQRGGIATGAPAEATAPPESIQAQSEPSPVVGTTTEDAAEAAIEAVDRTQAERRKGMSPLRWILVLAVILVLLMLFFGGEPASMN